jgi:hypothetical protein
MGFALIWAEGLAVALLSLVLAIAWASRGRALRWLWTAVVYFAFFLAADVVVMATFSVYSREAHLIRTSWFYYSLAWLLAFVLLSIHWLRRGLRRPEPGVARAATAWPRGKLWLALAGAVVAFGLTFWNMDLSARADLAIARQDSGAVLLSMTRPPIVDAENAARIYAEAGRNLSEPIKDPWQDGAFRGIDAREVVDWKAPYVVELVKQHEKALALFRKAAAMPRCRFDRRPTLLDAATPAEPEEVRFRRGGVLLALDARVKAMQGNTARAIEDVAALFGMVRHVAGQFRHLWGMEFMAWRTLEDVLRLAPAGKETLPALTIPELPPLVRVVREEHVFLGILFPTLATQPSDVVAHIRKDRGSLAALATEVVGLPVSRIFILPDELVAMRRSIDDYQQAPRSAREETPKDWANLRKSLQNDRTSIFGVFFIKPKQGMLVREGSVLAALRQTGRTALAVVAYHHKHGRYPERIEQLVADFLPAVPVDPRDGQVLRIRQVPGGMVVYTAQDAEAVEGGKLRDRESPRPAPIFRLVLRGPWK